MQSKTNEHKTYSYYFNRIIPTASPHKITPINEAVNSTGTPKNLSINFRYHTEGNDPEKKPPVRKESIKAHLNTEKVCDPHKKYTFSLLANQIRQQKGQEGKECNNTHNNNTHKDLNIDSKVEKQKTDQIQQLYGYNYPFKSQQNHVQQKHICAQLCKQKEARIQAEKQCSHQKTENMQLNKKIKSLQRQVQEKDKLIKELSDKMEQSRKEQVEKELLIQQNSLRSKNKELSISSHTLSCHIDDSQHSFEKETKEWSNSTIIYNYEEEYKQVLTIFEIELNEQNYHDRLLSHIEKLFKRVEEMNRSLLAFKEKEKETVRISSHIRRLQTQNLHLGSLMAILNKQVLKINESLSQANKEIEVLHLSQLNSKYQLLPP